MTLENKLGITNPADLAREEERLSKTGCALRPKAAAFTPLTAVQPAA